MVSGWKSRLRKGPVPGKDGRNRPAPPSVQGVLGTAGRPLDRETRAFFEPRFGHDLGRVRIHADGPAAESARDMGASAYTAGHHVAFGEGKYRPHSAEGRRLLAHELVHAVQQGPLAGSGPLRLGNPEDRPEEQARAAAEGLGTGTPGPAAAGAVERPLVRRKVEIRPPGRGEASAFNRARELVDRLNRLSSALRYELKGQELTYTVRDAAHLSYFDRTLKGFIDRADVVPMRLITSQGLARPTPRARYSTVLVDFFDAGYVDLDDLMADDDASFESDLLHILTERFRVRNYARRIGGSFSDAEFDRAHRAGLDAEAALLQDMFNDPSIRYLYEEEKPGGTVVFAFRSRKEGYRVFHVIARSQRAVAGGRMWVQRKDGSRVSMEDFRKERAAATPSAAP